MNYKTNLMEEVLVELSVSFKESEIQQIRRSLLRAFEHYDVIQADENFSLIQVDDFNNQLIKRYMVKKSLSGITKSSIYHYVMETKKCLAVIDKRATDVTSEDIELYLISYKAKNRISNTSLYNMSICINNFFIFLEDEEIIMKNPMKKLPRIKKDTIPEPIFSKRDEERLYL